MAANVHHGWGGNEGCGEERFRTEVRLHVEGAVAPSVLDDPCRFVALRAKPPTRRLLDEDRGVVPPRENIDPKPDRRIHSGHRDVGRRRRGDGHEQCRKTDGSRENDREDDDQTAQLAPRGSGQPHNRKNTLVEPIPSEPCSMVIPTKFLTRTVLDCIVQLVNEISSDATEPLWKLILHASQRVEAAFEAELAPIGLSLSKLNVLAILLEAGEPIPLSRLATRLACVKSNVTQLVDRLESEGLVARIDDPNDRRSVLAAITDLGRGKAGEGSRVMQLADAALFAGLDSDDRPRVERFLASLTSGQCGG